MISLNVKVPEDLDLVGLCNFLRNMVVPFCSHLDTPFLTQILMNYISQLVMSSFVLCLGHLTALADNMEDSLLSALLHIMHIRETFAFSILAFITFVMCSLCLK